MNISKVLIVDDSLLGRKSIINIISQRGFEIIEASDGLEALEKVESEKPDLMFLDLLMPNLDGFGVLQELKNRKESMPVIVVSADIQDSTIKQCMELGASGYLNKPLDQNVLDSLLAEMSGK